MVRRSRLKNLKSRVRMRMGNIENDITSTCRSLENAACEQSWIHRFFQTDQDDNMVVKFMARLSSLHYLILDLRFLMIRLNRQKQCYCSYLSLLERKEIM